MSNEDSDLVPSSPNNENDELLPTSTTGEKIVDAAALLVSLVPTIGGPLGSILSGYSSDRKMKRVGEVIENLSDQLKDFEFEQDDKYINSEEFEDLLEKTLKQSSEELHEEKRRLYAAYLANLIKYPRNGYDESLRYLRALDQLQPDHLRVIQALGKDPLPEETEGISGSPIHTLQDRLPEMGSEKIIDLVNQLNDLRVINLENMHTMMTARGAADLKNRITPFGNRFLTYIQDAKI